MPIINHYCNRHSLLSRHRLEGTVTKKLHPRDFAAHRPVTAVWVIVRAGVNFVVRHVSATTRWGCGIRLRVRPTQSSQVRFAARMLGRLDGVEKIVGLVESGVKPLVIGSQVEGFCQVIDVNAPHRVRWVDKSLHQVPIHERGSDCCYYVRMKKFAPVGQ